MHWWNKIVYYGLWTPPLTFLALLLIFEHFSSHKSLNINTYFLCFILSLLPALIIYSNNELAYKNGKRDFHILDFLSFSTSQYYRPSTKQEATYPTTNEALRYKKPEGIVFGKSKGSYICRSIHEDGHVFVIGGAGSGKSSCLVIPTLLTNPDTSIFAIDIKGELSFKSSKYGNPHDLIFNPCNRRSYGYNPFYNLNEDSTNQEILEAMQNIAFSLISMSAGLKDPFWKTSARNLLIGLSTFYYKHESKDFITIIDLILSQPVKESIARVMNEATPNSTEYRYTVQFSDMSDETLSGVFAELANHIVIFANDQDIRYALKDNPQKLEPTDLNIGYSIYLSIKEEKLSSYYDLLQLIINQTIAEMEKRPEDSKPILFIIDELPRILSAGKLDRLLDGARTLRSRRVIFFLITQSTEALMSAFTEKEVYDLISNCPYIMVLSATSVETQNAVIAWCGKYLEKKQTISGTGSKRTTSVTFEQQPIVESSDLMTLPQTGEAILISPYGYNRIRKLPYYSDKYFKPLSDEIITYNKTILEMEE
ncbi:MAG: type IV secretory system conjugative DNA transfer family protein [Lachnospiraceae bacterium]|nr:type IV secretory system conjugative DNA transfer family protein [Lachnospiraceae bacterium]